MKLVDKCNTVGTSFSVGVHVREDTEAHVSAGREEGNSVIRLGECTIFLSDADLALLVLAGADHLRLRRSSGTLNRTQETLRAL